MRLINFNSNITINLQEAKWSSKSVSMVRKVLKVSKLKKNGITVNLSNDKHVKSLNYRWKGENKTTNVLSFPNYEDISLMRKKQNFLGDIILGFETLKKESFCGNICITNHMAHLLVHGILHLKGFTHETRIDEKIMQREEIRILKILKIQNPYKNNRFL